MAYAFAGVVYWLWLAVGSWRTVRRVPVLAGSNDASPAQWPTLSVIVPACNEAESIGATLKALLAQDYPGLEIIAIDDRSTDATGAAIDAVAAGDSRLRKVRIEHLPEGWLGKVHALSRGVAQSTGKWLLFMDADVQLAPAALRKSIAFCLARNVDHMAAMPDLWGSHWAVNILVSMFLRTFSTSIRAWEVSDPHSRAFAGVGAFNLARRAAYDRTPGFEWLRLEVVDDMALGMMLKDSGARSALVNGRGVLGLYWYRSLTEVAHGSEKAYASVARCSPWRMLGMVAVILAMELAPWVLLAPWSIGGLWPASAAMFAALGYCILVGHRWAGRPVLPGLLAPVAALLSAAVLLRSGWLGWRRGGIVWRKTLYPSAALRAGRRIRLF